MAEQAATTPEREVEAPLPITEQIKMAMEKGEADFRQSQEPDRPEEEETEDTGEPELDVADGEPEETVEEESDDSLEVDEADFLAATVPVTVNGETQEVTVEEAAKGYMRTADYTRKTQDIAKQKMELSKSVEAYRGAIATVTAQVTNELQAYQRVDWNGLRASDPNGYAAHRAAAQDALDRHNNLQAELQRASQDSSTIRADVDRDRQADELNALAIQYPELRQPEEGKQLTTKWFTYAMEEHGFSNDELQDVMDHRFYVLLDKAQKYDEMTKEQGEIKEKKVRKVPRKVKKEGAPEAKTNTAQNAEEATAAMRTLQETGTVRDAANFLLRSGNIL